MHKCELCDRTNYQTATFPTVFDAYCVACRGLFNLLTITRRVSAKVAEKMLDKKSKQQ